ncbi:EF-P lysine aminoacylase EpmA [Methylococcus capsulatus]|uniref:EF-P lysine aminoacylase EpmA n=1 Tax=Methylococcus capsulatus TaxID=414 RepID=UPI001C52FF45|nr:EF-P lysine aminoacylase EpmA [Methylococcus capsulatus]QXP87968.1 EF-P lysine aminoacylase GenX [Methylococcus capsulatus]QXP95020.1 EF-P lysine aminoacylase GenX [Methylococcus capsulatus]UQN12991.1 EF-P lysine aminoacylase EpmA [Methylococcus capsulatus]
MSNRAPSDWRPSCPPAMLRRRAELLRKIRRFFAEREVLEVETPLLSHGTVTDPHLSVFSVGGGSDGSSRLFLQTSPEFAMKRLLAAGSGSIYQICKAFRRDESGRFHNPEFTLLEWYRVGFGLDELIEETDALLQILSENIRPLAASEHLSYRESFLRHAGIDPLDAGFADFAGCAASHGLQEAEAICGTDRSIWLDLLFSHLVQPHLGRGRFTFVRDFPAILPSLARFKPDDERLVERVEVFLDGLELGNGFFELCDPLEQEYRFERDIAARIDAGLPVPEKDRRLLDALKAGLPDCAGIALGIDRLLLGLHRLDAIADTLAFPLAKA